MSPVPYPANVSHRPLRHDKDWVCKGDDVSALRQTLQSFRPTSMLRRLPPPAPPSLLVLPTGSDPHE